MTLVTPTWIVPQEIAGEMTSVRSKFSSNTVYNREDMRGDM
jgi:hypothetical protein